MPQPLKPAPTPLRWWLIFWGYDAITLPPLGIYCLPTKVEDVNLSLHENTHWQQYLRMGAARFYLTYLWYNLRYGYWNNPMEVEARQATMPPTRHAN